MCCPSEYYIAYRVSLAIIVSVAGVVVCLLAREVSDSSLGRDVLRDKEI